jgi:hypothetical protein
MINREQVSLSVLRAHENALNPKPNMTLGGYNMPPAEEFVILRYILEDADLDRIFLLADCMGDTVGNVGRLKGVQPTDGFKERVQKKIDAKTDLRTSRDLAVVFVSWSDQMKSLTAIDGNHRLAAHYLIHGSIEGSHAFVCIHPKIKYLTNIPPLARI